MRRLGLAIALLQAGCTILFGDPRQVSQANGDGGIGSGGSDGGILDGATTSDPDLAASDLKMGGPMNDAGPKPGADLALALWVPMVTGSLESLNAVWRCDATTLLAVGANGTLLTYSSNLWSVAKLGPEALSSVGGTSCATVFVVGDAGAIYKGAAGGAYTRDTSGVSTALRAVEAVGNAVQVVGDGGVILKLGTGGAWSTVSSPTTMNLQGLYGSAQWGWFAVGEAGTLLAGDTSSWQSVSCGASTALRTAFGGSKYLFAAGDAATAVRTSDGLNFTTLALPTTAALHGVWATGQSDVWVVGDGGLILHSPDAGTSWSLEPSGTTANLRAVWGTSASDIWIVGDTGTVLHHG